MASTKIGAMRIDIGADSAQFDKAMSDVQRNLAKVGAKFEAIGAKTADWGKKLSIGLTLPIAGIAAAAIDGARAQAAAMSQVDAAIKSMGNQAGLSSEQLAKFADKLEMNSLVDADEILVKSTANLLTFGNIAGETFLKAQQAAVDMAARMGSDVQSATIMIGKALNDPAKGLSALSKAGIQFTDSQKETIKSLQKGGDVAGAQAIMLAELNKQFGGAAAAAAKADPMRQVMVKLGQAGDAIGEKLLPILPNLTNAVVGVLDAFTSLSPEMQKTVVIGGGIAAAFGPALIAIGSLTMGVGKVLPLMVSWGPVIWTVTKAMAAMALTPVGAVITGIAVAVGAVYLAWKNWDKITAIMSSLYSGVKSWLADKLGAVLDWVGKKVTALVQPFKYLWDQVVGHSWVPDLVDGIQAEFARLDKVMVDPTTKATQTAGDKFKAMAERVSGIMDSLFPEARALRTELEALAALEADTSLSGDVKIVALSRQRQRVTEARTRATDEQYPAIQPLPGALDDAWNVATGEAKRLGDGMMMGMEAKTRFRDDFRLAFSDGIHAALDGNLKGLFKSWIADTAARGLQSAIDAVGNALGGLLSGGSKGGGGGFFGSILKVGGTHGGGGSSRIVMA